MYGLVNEAIRGMVLEQHGEALWREIAGAADVDEEFIALHSYSDADTYALVGAASERLGAPVPELLRAFGAHWIRFTAAEGYGPLVDLMGDSLEAFLLALGDDLHGRVSSTMPALRPPEFETEQRSDTEYLVRYRSDREGLAPMVQGLLEGLALKYERKAAVEMLASEETAEGGCRASFRVLLLDR